MVVYHQEFNQKEQGHNKKGPSFYVKKTSEKSKKIALEQYVYKHL